MAAPGLLFLCDASSARSQLAESLVRERFGERLRILDGSALDAIELVITLSAETVCPAFPAPVRRLHWPIADPTADRPEDASFRFGAEAMRKHRVRVARLALASRLDLIEPALALPPGTMILPAATSDRAELEALLVSAALPLDGLDSCFPHDVVLARLDGALVGAAGLERWGAFGLLRSVVVAEAYRGKHIAEVLITDRLCAARLDALHAVYLLTSDAGPYFERFGFTAVDRDKLPAALAGSAQISGPSCPTARAMVQQLADSSRTDALLDEHIAKELAAAGTLVPPWTKFPELPRRSLGWRMGPGEWYLWMWQRWWEGVGPAERAAYVARWSADVPAAWLGWLPALHAPAG